MQRAAWQERTRCGGEPEVGPVLMDGTACSELRELTHSSSVLMILADVVLVWMKVFNPAPPLIGKAVLCNLLFGLNLSEGSVSSAGCRGSNHDRVATPLKLILR